METPYDNHAVARSPGFCGEPGSLSAGPSATGDPRPAGDLRRRPLRPTPRRHVAGGGGGKGGLRGKGGGGTYRISNTSIPLPQQWR